MGFFQDLKDDLSQAVNELMDDESVNKEEKETEGQQEKSLEQELSEAIQDDISDDQNGDQADQEGQIKASEEDTQVLDSLMSDIMENAVKTGVDLPTGEEAGEADIVEMEENGIEKNEIEESGTEEAGMEPEEVSSIHQAPALDDESEALVSDVLKEMQAVKEKHAKIEKNGSYGTMEDALDETAVITSGMTVRGNVSTKGSIDIIGSIEGDVEALGKLNITGSIKGNSKAEEVFANEAKIVGEINALGNVKIGASTVVIGNVTATCAVIAGAIKGDIDVHGPVVLDTSAIVMGNIKSKSVQINNGAVIEGMCSQCYADVNPISFFDDVK